MVIPIDVVKKILKRFIPIFGGLWLLVEPFSLYEIVLPNIGYWRYLVLFLVCIGIAIISLFSDLFIGIKVIKSRKDADKLIFDLVDKAEKRVHVATIAGRSMVKRHDYKAKYQNFINSGVEYRLLVLNPDSNLVTDREILEDGACDDRIKKRIKGVLKYWKDVRSQLHPDIKNDKLNIKLHTKGPLANSIWIIDEKIIFVPYLYGALGENCPMLLIKKTSSCKDLFEKLENNFKKLWADAEDVDWDSI